MKPSDISESLNGLIDARQTVFVWGGPGIGSVELDREALPQSCRVAKQSRTRTAARHYVQLARIQMPRVHG